MASQANMNLDKLANAIVKHDEQQMKSATTMNTAFVTQQQQMAKQRQALEDAKSAAEQLKAAHAA